MLTAAPTAGRRRLDRSTALLLTVLAVAALTASPAAGASPSSSSSGPGSAMGGAVAEDAPIVASQADLDAQQRRLDQLRADARRHGDDLAGAQAQLQLAATRSAVALERYAGSTHTLVAAEQSEQTEQSRLLRAELELAAQRRQLARWVREAYAQGPLSSHPALVTVLSAGPTDDLANTLQVLRMIGRSQQRAVQAAAGASVEQVAAVAAAQAASRQAEQATVDAATARRNSGQAVQEQRDLVLKLQDTLAGSQQRAGDAQRKTEQLRTALAEQQAREALLSGGVPGTGQSPAASTGNAVTGPVGDCPGGDLSGYPNGQIPAELLCPLAGAPGHRLRADAAYAYDQLASAYRAQFGSSLCITDSYRSLAVQQRVYQEKPGLAAVPGTSNHGWGTAVDLCGGIQNFGTAQHEWMSAHAPLFNWFHPAWAEPGGSRPEPWHWEFGG